AHETESRDSLDEETVQSSHIKKLRSASPADIHRYRDERRPFIGAIQQACAMMEAGAAFETACSEFVKLDGAIRCFVLGGDGGQIGPELAGDFAPAPQGMNISDMIERVNGDWSRRDFFRRAMREPEAVQVTRRYASLSGYAHCVTFSMAARIDAKPVVICGDVDWSTHARIH
ncbi:MAG: hypothetical protein H7X76_02645, partial [Prolixibacteraceae bacterium]|nr:hypothetical protein [Burkholderiales bacterium]